MNIACVAYLGSRGGAQRQIILLANHLAREGHDVSLINLAGGCALYDVCPNVTLYNISLENQIKSLGQRFLALHSFLKKIKPDVSIHYWLQSAYFCALMPKKICGKIVYAERTDPGCVTYSKISRFLRFLSFNRVDAFVFQSKGARDFFGKDVRARSIVIPNAHSIPDGVLTELCMKREKKIVSVGRLHPQKNQAVLIKAFASIANEITEYDLEIYGDGELREELLDLTCELKVENRVHIYPSCKNIYEKMHSASLFVLSSDYEGMPNALMEAMALGVPCISTDCNPGGARELIENDVNGWIIPKGNTQSLAEKICFVLKECHNVDDIAKKAQNIRYKFSSRVVYKKWNDFIQSLLEK